MHPKILGLDIGSVRIGVAISDGLQMLAHPLTTLKWKNETDFLEDLKKIIADKNTQTLVVGVPYTLKGTHSAQTERVLKLVELIRQALNIKLETIDERLTSKMAENMLKEVNKKPSKNRHIIDQIAAVNILQTYLDKKRV
jgi:putative pre-16S rRNA nuclease